MRRRSLFGSLLPALFGASLALTASTTARADTWTVMVYLEANNSLEPFANETFSEMMKVGKTKNLTTIVELDTGKHKSTQKIEGMPSGSGVKRLLVRKGSVESENDDVGDDMTTSKGLASFIKFARKEHGADHYALVLWDHGAGWHGCCEAETPDLRGMTLETIAKGIEGGLKGTDEKLDVVAFDECLMGEIDVAAALAPFVKVMVASEELEPGEGMDYDKWLKAIANDSSITPDGVGRAIADAYVDHVESQSGSPSFTLSVLELKHYDDVGAAAARLAKQLEKVSGDADTWSQVGAARAKADQFGGQQADLFGLVDLGRFAKFCGQIDGITAADDLLNAMDHFVKYSVAGPMHKKATGLSAYLPQNEMDADYSSAAFSDKWTKLAETYAQGASQDTTPPDTSDVDISEEPDNSDNSDDNKGGHQRSTLALTGLGNDKDLAQVNLVLAEDRGDGKHVFLGEVPLKDAEQMAEEAQKDPKANDKIKYDWSGTWPMVTDGKTTIVAPLYAVKEFDSETDGQASPQAATRLAIVEMPADLDDGSGGGFTKAIRVQFQLDLIKLEGKLISAYEIGKAGAGAIKLTPDEKVRPYEVLVADKGKWTQKPGSTVLAGSLSMVSQKLPDKKYMLGVHLIDYAGNQSTKLVDVSALLAKAAKQQQQGQKSGCAKKCEIGFDDDGALGWLAPMAIGATMIVRRRRRRGE